MLVSELVGLIRDFLHDPLTDNNGNIEYDRYSPSVIQTYINLGLVDFVSSTDLNKKSDFLPYPTSENPFVELPEGVITAIKLNGCPLVEETEEETCNIAPSVPLTTDKPKLILNSEGTKFSLTQLGTSLDNLVLEPLDFDYGIITYDYGAMPDLSKYSNLDTYIVDTPYGASRLLQKTELYNYDLKVEYNALPSTDGSSEFPLDDKYLLCIKHYVCGHLLRDDKDAQSHSIGVEELTLYKNCVVKAEQQAKKGGNIQLDKPVSTSYEIPYIRSI